MIRVGLAVTLLVVSAALAQDLEVIEIPVGQQGAELAHLARPTRGMSSAEVVARFGEPVSVAPTVGDPPVSRWQYEDFAVYFESEIVIHTVLQHRPAHPVP